MEFVEAQQPAFLGEVISGEADGVFGLRPRRPLSSAVTAPVRERGMNSWK